jgi:hypothetical protein
MDILNFISWIAGKKRVVTSVPDNALIPVGIRTETRDDKYTTVAIRVSDFANQVGDPSVTFVQGSLEPTVQATMSPIGGTITTANGNVFKKYRIQGTAKLGGATGYALFTLVMTAGAVFEADVVIDFTIAVPETATIEFVN